MRILLLGGGGREHALAWKLDRSDLCEALFIGPGNAGTSQCGTNLPLNPTDFEAVKASVLEHRINMVIVGPEAPLVEGIWNFFQEDTALKDVALIGPSRSGALLEGSKAYAKTFMVERNIPTAAYREFTLKDEAEGLAYLDEHELPIVLKADGLAAGKGVLIHTDCAQAKADFSDMLRGKFGAASEKVVVEQFLDGIEFSVFALTDGKDYVILPEAKDYKRIGEGDTGLNTGGMGSVSPVSFADATLMQKVEDRIIRPTVEGLAAQNIPYCGFIFFGLIVVDGEPFVIEYNCRMGDPETQVVMPRLENDLVELLDAAAKGTLASQRIKHSMWDCMCSIMVSGGYPGSYERGKAISGLDQLDGSLAFYAGITEDSAGIPRTSGGRVLAITSLGVGLQDAIDLTYEQIAKVQFDGMYHRRDIGKDVLEL